MKETMDVFIIAHGHYTNQSNKFRVPENCTITYYENHGELLSFDEGYDAIRGLIKVNAMEMCEKTISTCDAELMDYVLSTQGNCPMWTDLNVNKLGVYIPNYHDEILNYSFGNFECKLSELVIFMRNRLNPKETLNIIMISCRGIYRLPDDMEIINW